MANQKISWVCCKTSSGSQISNSAWKVTWKGPPSALMFSFADEDENFGLVQPIGQISEDTRKARIDTVRRRIIVVAKASLKLLI